MISFRAATAIAAIIVAGYLGAQVLLSDNSDGAMAFSDISSFLINCLAVLSLLYAAKCSRRSGEHVYIAWLMLAFAQFLFALGDVAWSFIHIVLRQDPFGSPADVPYLMYYPIFLMGVLILPAASLNRGERLKMLLDTSIVLIAAVLAFWALLIAPTIEASSDADPISLALSIAYPVMDLILLFALIELLFRKITLPGRRTLLLLAADAGIMIFTDAIYMRQVLDGTYVPGGLLDIGWTLSYILAGLAGISYVDILKSGFLPISPEASPRYGQFTWPLYLPYLCAAGAFLLLVWSHDHSSLLSFSSFSWATGGIIGLVIIRQVLALNENTQLYTEAEAEIIERKQAEREVTRLNEELERRVIERTSQLEATNRTLQGEVSERKLAETALKESQRRLADIINFLPDATFVIDKEGKVIAWNRAIESVTGIKAKEILGKGNYEYALPFYGERRPILIDLVRKSEQVFEGRYSGVKMQDDGTLMGEAYTPGLGAYLLGSAAVLYDSEGNIAGAIESIRDITESKRTEKDLHRAKEAAESAMCAKSEFLANMSHEIRTPMNAVIGMTGLLLETKMDPDQRDCIETIRSSGDALLALINDILDFSKIEGDKLELESLPFDLRACVEESLDLVASAAAKKDLELAYVLEDTPETVLGDVTRLRQILVNLLGNAVKFTENGEVVLSVGAAALEEDMVELHFAVKDTGIGIPRDRMNRLFQSFSQVDSSTTRQYGGTGLGLAISKRLVEMMGGKIWVESEKGYGSTFHFTAIVRSATAGEYVKDVISQILTDKRILIVEDNTSVRKILSGVTRSWGMKPIEVASGRDALDILIKGEPFDVVLLDAVIPGTDCSSLIRSIKDNVTVKPLIVVISPLGCSITEEPLIAGWLTKPIRHRQLRGLLEDLISSDSISRAVPDIEPCRDRSSRFNLHILLAEDNPVNQKVALRMLERLGYSADVAANGLEVLQALERQPYDVVLMDIQMPEMDGLEATRRIRASGQKIWVIAMTAYALKGDKEECIEAGMDDYISKPVRIEDLQAALERSGEIMTGSRSHAETSVKT